MPLTASHSPALGTQEACSRVRSGTHLERLTYVRLSSLTNSGRRPEICFPWEGKWRGVLRTSEDPLPHKARRTPWKRGTNVETPGCVPFGGTHLDGGMYRIHKRPTEPKVLRLDLSASIQTLFAAARRRELILAFDLKGRRPIGIPLPLVSTFA